MKTLIIGANGFLGSHLLRTCIAKKWKTSCLVHKNRNRIPENITTYTIDELDRIEPDFDCIFLLAANIRYAELNTPNKEVLNSNLTLPLSVTKKFQHVRIVFSSSVSVYGKHTDVINEYSSYNSPNFYGLTKLAAETIIQTHNSYSIVRFSSIYGKHMSNEVFMSRIISDAKFKKEITLYGNGERKQNYIYVEDAVTYLLLAAEQRSNGIYLGVNNKSFSNKQIAETIKKYVICNIQYTGIDNSPSYIYDNTLTRKSLGDIQCTDLNVGIQTLL